MAIKYEVHTIENAVGTGKEREFIRLRQHPSMSDDDIAKAIQEATTLTTADVKAVMSAISSLAVRELNMGDRFHLPEIGYLSLSVGNTPRSKKKDGKITGNDIYLRNINFQPEEKFLYNVEKGMKFEKSKASTRSKRYDEEDLWNRVEQYLKEKHFITCRSMRVEFHLSEYKAREWLRRFVKSGKLVNSNTDRQPVYLLASSEKV